MVNNGIVEAFIPVTVAIAFPGRQQVIELLVEKGCSARQAVEQSGIAAMFPDMDFKTAPMGIYSRPMNGIDLPLPERYLLEENDRVEIYRPLAIDPKQARMERARKRRHGKS